MIFTSRKLERALAQGKITGWGAARYYFVPMIFTAVISMPCWLIRPRHNVQLNLGIMFIQLLLQVLAGIIVYRGVKKCFNTNQQIDSSDFISRMVILAFPVLIKVIWFSFIVSIILVYFMIIFLPQVPVQVIVAALSPILTFTTFFLLNESLQRFALEKR